jgi:malonate transporter
MLEILAITFPFFALVLCGYLAAHWRAIPLDVIPGLNVFVLFFALPCMLYQFASTTPIVRLLDVGISVTYLLCALTMVALTIATTRSRSVGWSNASFGALVASFPNSAFMGVPLLVALLGAKAAGPAIVSLAVDMVLTSSLCIALSQLDAVSEQGAGRAVVQVMRGMLTNPLPWAILLGCVSSATGLQLPHPAMRAVEMLAQAASPAALFTIGAVLTRPRLPAPGSLPGQGSKQDAPKLAFYKLIVHPALIFVIGRLLIAIGMPLDAFSLSVLVLVAAMPSANNVPILAERFGADMGRVARVVLLTTAFAFVTIPATVAVLNPPRGLSQ